MREYLIDKKFDESCITVIPNMVNLRKERTTRHYHNPIVIGAMSRFVKKKGIDILLQSVAQLTAQHYDVRVIIAGNGEEKDNLIRLVKDLQLEQCVSFVGWVEDKEKFFNEIDIFCLPSLHEPFGIILLEAMANAIPIIATSVEGPSEIMRSRQDGLLCIPGSFSELATKIAYMLINPLDAKKYAESAYYRVKAKYTISVVAPQLSNFIKSIIANR
jgi:glycosyltransferase involved in cell wall biosynthesis